LQENQIIMDWENIPENIDDYLGFVYIIINTVDHKYYLGRKYFTKQVTRPPLKGYKRKRKSRVESDWKTYYGSSNSLLEDIEKHGKDKFRRIILKPCKSKWECSFFELKYQIHNNVLYDDRSYNSIINIRLNKVPKGSELSINECFDLDIDSYLC
jgi:Putative endonuclease segE, GIY-YIG domain